MNSIDDAGQATEGKYGTVNSNDDLCFTSAVELAAAIRERKLSPVEVVDAVLARIDEHDDAVNAFITVIGEEARAAARRAEAAVMTEHKESLGRLHGVPIAIKDLTPTAGVRTTYGLKERADFVPEEDSIAWGRLKAEGPILIGKTATPPLGCLCTTESELNGLTNNPWDLSRTVGGSSGGSAAAVAAGFVPISTGSDGGASIRLPSAYCGAVGLKASLGRIPIYPEGGPFELVLAVGPITRTVTDCALLTSIMSGPHASEPFAILESGVDFVAPLERASVKGRRIALCYDGFGPVEDVMVSGMQEAAENFSALGATTEFVRMDMPDGSDFFINFWCALMSGEVLSNAGVDVSAYPPLQEWVELGSKVNIADHLDAALGKKAQMHAEFMTVFERFDILILPSAPGVAFPHPDPDLGGPEYCNGVKVRVPGVDFGRFTDPPTQANLPALAMPCAFSPEGLPIGMQVVGPQNQEGLVLEAGFIYERAAGLLERRPNGWERL